MTFQKIMISLVALCVTHLAVAKSPVWKVTDGEHELFIGGTIHLLSADDYPLPDAFDVAFSRSSELVFETDVDSASSVSAQLKFMPSLMYQDGRTIESVLSPETYADLTTFLAERKLPLTMFERFKPAGLNLTLLVLELQRLGINAQSGVETHFSAKAKKDEKRVAWFESLDEQIEFIDRMNTLDPNLLIGSTLRDIGTLEEVWPTLLSAWKAGNMQQLASLGLTQMIQEAPELYQFILVDRNKNWMPEIKELLETPDIEFILVGALHLAGKDSVLRQLEEEGYEVEQLD